MSQKPDNDYTAGDLSEAQILALGEVADGVEEFAHTRTLTSLQERGLITKAGLTRAGRIALDGAMEQMPALFRERRPDEETPGWFCGWVGCPAVGPHEHPGGCAAGDDRG